MKKLVSLLLAGAMIMSFATVGNAAAGIDTPVLSGTIGEGWTVSAEKGVTEETASFSLSDDNAYSLPYSLKLSHPVKADSATDVNYRIGITFPVKLVQGSKYKIRFKSTEPMHSTYINQNMYFGMQLGWHRGCMQYSSPNAKFEQLGDSGWYQNEFDYTALSTNLLFGLNTNCNSFEDRYFDDFEISLVTEDASGNEVLTPVDIKDAAFDATAVEEEEPSTGENFGTKQALFYTGTTRVWVNDLKFGKDTGVTRTITVSDDAYEGDYSARVIWDNGTGETSYGDLWLNNFLTGTNGKTDKYTVKMKVKGNPGTQFAVGFGEYPNYAAKIKNNDSSCITVLEDGWKELTVVCDGTTKSLDTSFRIRVSGGADVLIDDVSIYNETDSAYVPIKVPGFESFYFDDPQNIMNAVANGGKEQIVVSWYNPSGFDLTDVQVLENGTEISASAEKTDWTFTKNGYNRLIIKGLTAGDEHTYTIRAYKNASDYKDYNVSATVGNGRYIGSPKLTDGNYAENWAIQYSNGIDGIVSSAETGLYLDSQIKYSGDYALRVEINEQQTAANTYVNLYKSFPVEAGKTYRISYMGKGAVVGANTACLLCDTSIENRPWNGTKFTAGTSEWKRYEREYKVADDAAITTANVYIQLQGASRTRSIWIDDVKVQEVLADGSYGENILNGGGFEKEITNLTESKGILSWDKDGLFYDYVNIYEKKADGSLKKVNENEKITGTSYLLKDSFFAEKTYVVKAVLLKGYAEVESAGVEITVDGKYSIPEDEKFEQVIFESDFSGVGEGVQVIKKLDKIENGNIMASITIANKNGDWSLPVKYFAALYDGERLVDVAVMEKTIGWRGTETLSAVVNVADVNAGNYTIKTFLWDNNLTPFKAVGELSE